MIYSFLLTVLLECQCRHLRPCANWLTLFCFLSDQWEMGPYKWISLGPRISQIRPCPRQSGPGSIKDQVAWLPPQLCWVPYWCVVASRTTVSGVAVDHEVFWVVLGLLPHDPPQNKSGYENEWMTISLWNKLWSIYCRHLSGL